MVCGGTVKSRHSTSSESTNSFHGSPPVCESAPTGRLAPDLAKRSRISRRLALSSASTSRARRRCGSTSERWIDRPMSAKATRQQARPTAPAAVAHSTPRVPSARRAWAPKDSSSSKNLGPRDPDASANALDAMIVSPCLVRARRAVVILPPAAEAAREPALLLRGVGAAAALLDQLQHRGAQRPERHRLVHEHRDAQRLERVLRQPIDAARHHQDGGGGQQRAQGLGQGDAGHVGQVEVEQHDPWLVQPRLLARLGAVVGLLDREIGAAQEFRHLVALHRVVLDDEDVAPGTLGHESAPVGKYYAAAAIIAHFAHRTKAAASQSPAYLPIAAIDTIAGVVGRVPFSRRLRARSDICPPPVGYRWQKAFT